MTRKEAANEVLRLCQQFSVDDVIEWAADACMALGGSNDGPAHPDAAEYMKVRKALLSIENEGI